MGYFQGRSPDLEKKKKELSFCDEGEKSFSGG